jgi:hypothetical protein
MIGFGVIMPFSIAEERRLNKLHRVPNDFSLDAFMAMFGMAIGTLGVVLTVGTFLRIQG